jgi:uncharacterized protein (TIGR02145 family)
MAKPSTLAEMKQPQLLILMILASFGHLTAQTTITLTFTAEVNGNHLPLDSVLIENLTQGGDTTLYAPDTVLVLDHGIGIEDKVNGHGNQMILFPAYPNPVTHTSTIRLFLPQDVPVTLRLYDLVGRELPSFTRTLGAGEHSFTFTPGRETYYLLVAEAADQRQLQKLINLSPGDGNCRLSYAGHQPAVSGMKKGKSAFPWVPGDDLRFVGYASVGVDTIDDDPVQSAVYTFQFLQSGVPCPGIPVFPDINGNVYNTVQIGNQCWLKENLKVRNYRDGTPIPNLESAALWMSATTGARCWYNNDSATYANLYGALYNWNAVGNSIGLCPTGWHVPTDVEWTILINFLGGGSIAGGPLKETGTTHWNSPNTGASNSSAFTALPGGHRKANLANFFDIGDRGYWWSATPDGMSAWYMELRNIGSLASMVSNDKQFGISVRCVRD